MNVNSPEDFEGNISELNDEVFSQLAAIFEAEAIRRQCAGRVGKHPIAYKRSVEYSLYRSPNTNKVLMQKMEDRWSVGAW